MTVRRMKTYTAQTGYVYQYYFVGQRDALDSDPAYKAAVSDGVAQGEASPLADNFVQKYLIGAPRATSDRKGREIKVERIQTTRQDKRQAEAPRRGPKRPAGDKGKARDRFARETKRERPTGGAPHRRGGDGPRSPHRPRRG